MTWFQTWLHQYQNHCLGCGLNCYTKKGRIYIIIRLRNAPKLSKICGRCALDPAYVQVEQEQLLTVGVTPAEVSHLAIHTSHHPGRVWMLADVKKFLTEKEAQRKQQIEDLLDAHGNEDEKTTIRTTLWTAAAPDSFDVLLKIAYKNLYQAETPPTMQDLLSMATSAQERAQVNDSVVAELQKQGKSSLQGKVQGALKWHVYLANLHGCVVYNGRSIMPSWEEAIAWKHKSVAEFVEEIQKPVWSHVDCKCVCGGTPALACTERKCGRCCSRNDCYRHPARSSRG